jgi:hypothetical protein
MLCFCLSLIEPSTFNFLMCECEHRLDAFSAHLTCCPFGGQQIATHDNIQDVMYAFVLENGHVVWKERWYTLTLGISLWTNLYMTWEDQVFVFDVVVIDLMQETMVLNVISRLANAIVKLNVIAKIHKYRGHHEGYHFIPMAMEVHGEPRCDINHFIRECARLIHNRWSKGHLSLSFYIQFFRQCVGIAFQCALAFAIKRKIALTNDVYSKPLITIRSHNLHASNIREAMHKIPSYHKKD